MICQKQRVFILLQILRMLCEGIILAIALFAGVNNPLGIFVIVHYNEFVFFVNVTFILVNRLFVYLIVYLVIRLFGESVGICLIR